MYFKHNDTDDLERILLAQQKLDHKVKYSIFLVVLLLISITKIANNKNPKKAARQRRFLIAEAIYLNSGEMCPLPRLVQLRQQHKLRFILDESLSFGTVGKTGRGLTELLNVKARQYKTNL